MSGLKKRILGIPGSISKKSTSHKFLNYLRQKYREDLDIEVYDKVGELPHFNPELESALPDAVIDLRHAIEAADGILFCTPEYVFSLPGSLKNLIKWNVSTVLFSNKAVAMIVAAASGEKAFESLALVLTTIEAVLPDESKLLIQGAKGKFDPLGKLTDEKLAIQLERLINSFVSTIDDPDRAPSKYLDQ
ncbi:MAG: NADPH-dependent FMN reductase [Bacteroidia bacterium]